MTQPIICTNCGHIDTPQLETKGSGLIEILLWLFIFPVGVLYSIWRRTGRKNICTSCKSNLVIPSDSPRAKKVLEEFGTSMEQYHAGVEAEEKAKREQSEKESKRNIAILVIVGVVTFLAIFMYATSI